MSRWFRTIATVWLKDILCELRGWSVLPAVIVLAILIAWVFRICVADTLAASADVGSAVILAGTLFAGILIGERSLALERDCGCTPLLVLACGDAGSVFLGKWLANSTFLCFFELISVPAVAILFDLHLSLSALYLIIVLLFTNFGVAAVSTLAGAMVQGLRGQSSLLSIIVLAVLLPMIIPAARAIVAVFEPTEQPAGIGSYIGYIAAFDAIFVTLGWLLLDVIVYDQD